MKHYIYLFPTLIFMIALSIYPLAYLWYISFTDFSGGSINFIGLENYAYLILKDPVFLTSLQNTMLYIALSLGVEVPLGLGLALLLNRKFRGKSVFLIIIMIPMIIPPVVAGLTFRMLYDPTLGILNYLLSVFGLRGMNWLSDPQIAMLSVALIDIWQWTPFVTLVMLAGLQYLPLDVMEAAIIDGASSFQVLRYITLPLLKRIFALAILFRLVDSIKAFETIFLTTRGGPGYATQTLNIYTFLTSFTYFHFGVGAALAILMVIITTFLVLLLFRILR